MTKKLNDLFNLAPPDVDEVEGSVAVLVTDRLLGRAGGEGGGRGDEDDERDDGTHGFSGLEWVPTPTATLSNAPLAAALEDGPSYTIPSNAAAQTTLTHLRPRA